MDATLLERIAAGDPRAVGQCIDQYGNLVWSIVRRMAPAGSDAEDAVQEIFVDLWKSAPRFRPEKASETTFVAMIARRRMIDRIRSAERAAPTMSIPEDMEFPNEDHVRVERGAEAALALKSLEALRPEHRQVVVLSILHGLTHEEISTKLEMPLGTVKSFLRRGLLAARQNLASGDKGVSS